MRFRPHLLAIFVVVSLCIPEALGQRERARISRDRTQPPDAEEESETPEEVDPALVSEVTKAVKAFSGTSWPAKKSAAEKLPRIGRPCVPLLIPYLDGAESELDCWIIKMLSEIGGDEARTAIIETALNGEAQVQLMAVSSLAVFKDEVTVADVAKLLESDDETVRLRAVTTLAKIGIPETLFPLITALRDSNKNVRFFAARLGLLNLSEKRIVPGVAGRVINGWKEAGQTPDENSIKLLGQLGDTESVPYLIDLVINGVHDTKQHAALALGDIASRDALRFLARRARLRIHDEDLQIAIMKGLGGTPDKRDQNAIPVLIDLLKDNSPAVRLQAASSLGRITGMRFGMNPPRWVDWWEREIFDIEESEEEE